MSCMKESKREALPTVTGWLVAPTRDYCLFFIRDPKSSVYYPSVLSQLWYCTIQGSPTKLKNTRRIDLDSAEETWRELISDGWELIEDQINDDAA